MGVGDAADDDDRAGFDTLVGVVGGGDGVTAVAHSKSADDAAAAAGAGADASPPSQ